VPDPGQSILVPGFEITILTVDGQRISEVKMTRRPNGDGPTEAEPAS
jgi:CBS domain containing-hemolysin-like protein